MVPRTRTFEITQNAGTLAYALTVETASSLPAGVDAFAALRRQGFYQLASKQPLPALELPGLDALSYMTALEFDWAQAFRTGFDFSQAPLDEVDAYVHSAILRGLLRSGAQAPVELLLRQMGVSDSSDALIREYLSSHSPQPKRLGRLPRQGGGITVAQFMFLGEIGKAGAGDSGGLGIFLESLGDALAGQEGVQQVYTVVLEHGDAPRLIERPSTRHSILYVPVPFERQMTQREMMAHSHVLEERIWDALAAFEIQPDVFHLRYADHGSMAAQRVGQRMGARIVFTLTADPHRTLVNLFGQDYLDEARMEALDFALQRVLAADRLLEAADAVVVMPNSAGLDPLKAYFPQFELDEAVMRKPVHVLAEGIRMQPPAGGTVPALPAHLLERPIMLNVGRLNPVKQQDLLVEAWAAGGLWRQYNLLLIGGTPDNPTEVEMEMMASIHTVLAQHVEARPYFHLLPAMDNQTVRALERAVVQKGCHDLPNLYVCSSVKEEFGIAVLEAMDAGFLVAGPERGGLSSYIQHGDNGFLMPTDRADDIAAALSIILDDTWEGVDLHGMAQRGQETVRSRFDISATATAFLSCYRSLIEVVEEVAA